MSLKVAALLLAVLVAACLASPMPRLRRNMFRGRPVVGLLQKPKSWHRDRDAVQGFFTNKVDHFSNSTATYEQRYWYNNQWYKPGGPIFLILGGEGPESGYWVEDGTVEMNMIAARVGAFVFQAEHRFYGDSKPTKDMSTENLAYLSSAQSIEDFASFIVGMNKRFPQLSGGKWVTFGGSYAGALAAWMRVKHPELVFAAVGSSGPVQAQVDVVEYYEGVQYAITRSSKGCADSVNNGMNTVAQLLGTAAGRQSLKSTFNLCQDLDTSNALQINMFWEWVYTPYTVFVQYSGQGGDTAHNVDNAICSFHNQNVSSLTKMRNVNQFYATTFGNVGCNDIDYDSYITAVQDTSYGDAQSVRGWVWQKCTEFGFMQSTDSPTAGPFFGGNNLPVQFYVDKCTAIYGAAYTSTSIAKAVAKTNAYYGGRGNMNSSKIILPNGNADPWHALGKLTSNEDTIVPVVIDGTSHCADMYSWSPNDSTALVQARQLISDTLTKWLQ